MRWHYGAEVPSLGVGDLNLATAEDYDKVLLLSKAEQFLS